MTAARPQNIVVIGAGIGGLAAAIRLAAAGMSVTLVEAQAGPGGKMGSLASVAGPVDAGPTVLTLRGVFDDLFAQAGERLDNNVTLIPHATLARHFWTDGCRLDLYADPQASAAAVASFAGAKAEAEFVWFNRLSAQLYPAFNAPMMQATQPNLPGILRNTLRNPAIWPALQPNRSLDRQLAKTCTDPRLRQLIGRYATYVGGAPDLSPAGLALIWQAEAQGVWAVQGGMHRLASALADLAARRGVTLRHGTRAGQILSKAGRAIQVVLSDTRSLKCHSVVFNGDPGALLAGRLGQGPQQSLPPSAAHLRSLSAWVWRFAATPSALTLIHHNCFLPATRRMNSAPSPKAACLTKLRCTSAPRTAAVEPPQAPNGARLS